VAFLDRGPTGIVPGHWLRIGEVLRGHQRPTVLVPVGIGCPQQDHVPGHARFPPLEAFDRVASASVREGAGPPGVGSAADSNPDHRVGADRGAAHDTTRLFTDRPEPTATSTLRLAPGTIRAPRLPEAVWTSAAALARTQGLSVVARTLRLDYYKLRRAAGASSSPTAPPAFVELQVAAVADPGPGLSTVELSDGTGARMTLRVPSERPTLLALARTFWRRSQ